MSTLTIRPGAAIKDAGDIEDIVERIRNNMSDLDVVIRRVIPEGVETEWSKTLKSNWEKFYTQSVAGVIDEIYASAVNLEVAVKDAIEYGKE